MNAGDGWTADAGRSSSNSCRYTDALCATPILIAVTRKFWRDVAVNVVANLIATVIVYIVAAIIGWVPFTRLALGYVAAILVLVAAATIVAAFTVKTQRTKINILCAGLV